MGKDIIWLSQFRLKKKDKDDRPDSTIGGAEITIDLYSEYLKKQGNNVLLMTPRSIDMERIKKADLVIFSNIIYGKINIERQWYTNNKHDKRPDMFMIEDLDWIINNKKFVNIEHDLKWHHLRNETVDTFPDTSMLKPEWWGIMMKKASLNVFLSPLQLKPTLRYFFKYLASEKYLNATLKTIRDWEKEWDKHWKDCIKDNITCIPPPVKKSVWSGPDITIKGTYGVIGAIYQGKGIQDILLEYKALGKNLRFIGNVADKGLANKIVQNGHTIVPTVEYKDMPNLLRKYQYIVVSRRIPQSEPTEDGNTRFFTDKDGKLLYEFMNEGFGRIIPESLNAGCEVLVDDDSKEHIGAYSYGWTNEEIINNCDIADKTFHDELINRKII